MDSEQVDTVEQLIGEEVHESVAQRADRLRKYLVNLQVFMGVNKTESMQLGAKSYRYHYNKTPRPVTTQEFKRLMHEEARLKFLLLYEGLAQDSTEVVEQTVITAAWA